MQKPTKTKITACIFISLFVLICVLSIYVIVLGIEATVRLQGEGHVIDSYWSIDRAVATFVTFPVMILASIAGIVFSVFKLRLSEMQAEDSTRGLGASKKINIAILICFLVIIVAFVCRVGFDL